MELIFDILIVALQSATIGLVWRDHRARTARTPRHTFKPPPRAPIR